MADLFPWQHQSSHSLTPNANHIVMNGKIVTSSEILGILSLFLILSKSLAYLYGNASVSRRIMFTEAISTVKIGIAYMKTLEEVLDERYAWNYIVNLFYSFVVRACYRAYIVAHVFKYLAPNFVSGRRVWMLLFTISVQLSVEPLIAHGVFNYLHA